MGTPDDYISQMLKRIRYSFQKVCEATAHIRLRHKEQYNKRPEQLQYKRGDRVLLSPVVPDKDLQVCIKIQRTLSRHQNLWFIYCGRGQRDSQVPACQHESPHSPVGNDAVAWLECTWIPPIRRYLVPLPPRGGELDMHQQHSRAAWRKKSSTSFPYESRWTFQTTGWRQHDSSRIKFEVTQQRKSLVSCSSIARFLPCKKNRW